MQICLDKIDGTENEWKSVEKGLNELFSSMSGEYKSKYPALNLAAIKADTSITAKKRAEKSGKSEKTVYRAIRVLRENHYIVRKGNDFDGIWLINNNYNV